MGEVNLRSWHHQSKYSSWYKNAINEDWGLYQAMYNDFDDSVMGTSNQIKGAESNSLEENLHKPLWELVAKN